MLTIPDIASPKNEALQTAADLVVSLQNICVRYQVPEERIGTFKEYAIRMLQRKVSFREFSALDDVNIDVYRGEIFGIVGRNGSGKSTLLKVISRVLAPTEGRVWIKGKVSPLLELGAGFHPELTGRENILLNGTLLGHPMREIQEMMPNIVEFAELGAFIDAPLRTYSSGMVARLGFAVATAWQPEILILDEILAVGDEAFQLKCQKRVQDFRTRGTTTFLVTHDMNAVQGLCTRAMLLDHGHLVTVGEVNSIIDHYRKIGS